VILEQTSISFVSYVRKPVHMSVLTNTTAKFCANLCNSENQDPGKEVKGN